MQREGADGAALHEAPGPDVSPTPDTVLDLPAGPPFLLGSALLLLVLAAYLPALWAGFVWDDDDYLVNNLTLRSPGGLVRIWLEPRASPQYYPLVLSTFWVESRLWGMNPLGYHAGNVVLHALSTVLLWRVLARLGVPGAWLAAALFAVHPVQVESVAWVAERKNVLSGLFYWAALLCYLRFAGLGEDRPGPWGWYAGSLALFLCALLSKTVTCTLPAVLVLLLWWKRRLTRRDAIALAPLFVLGIGMGLSTVFLEVTHVGARGAEYDLGTVERVLLAGRALCFYLGKLLVPVNLTFIYPRWQIDSREPVQYLYPAGALALAGVLVWARGRLGWGPLIAYLCFAVTLFPALGFFAVYPFRYSFVADHFQYLACAAPLAALAALATLAARHWRPAAGRLLTAALLVTLAGLTWSQAQLYRDVTTLFQDTLAKNPGCWMARNNLGYLALWRGHFKSAERQFRHCLEWKPDHLRARRGLAQALFGQGRPEEARAELSVSLRALEDLAREAKDSRQQEIVQEYLAIATVCEWGGADAEAERVLRLALLVNPDWSMGHFRLGNSLAKQGKFHEAIPHLRIMTEASPESGEAHYFLAQALDAAGEKKEAAALAGQALRLARAEGNEGLTRAILQRFASTLPAH
jgi:tetratricopeptide (TPR) repeat protein